MTKDLHSPPHAPQFKEACKLTRARWAAWLKAENGAWIFQSHAGLSAARLVQVQELLRDSNVNQWVAGALSSGRIRWREIGSAAAQTGCQRLYLFPSQAAHQVLMVGADGLDKNGEACWRLLAMTAETGLSRPPEPVTQPIADTRRLQETVQQLQALRQTLLELSSAQDLSTLLACAIRQARQLVDARGAEICLFEPQHSQPIFSGQTMPGKPAISNTAGTAPKTAVLGGQLQLAQAQVPWLPVSTDSAVKPSLHHQAHSYIASSGDALVIEKYSDWASGYNSADDAHTPPSTGRNMRSSPGFIPPAGAPANQPDSTLAAAGVPLKIKDEVLGTLLVVDNRPGKVFQETDLNLLELLAPQAAIALRNVWLIQELQERSQAQNLAESRLVRSARLAAVGEMVAGIAHELNNPLTTVTGFVELTLKEMPEGVPQRADLELALQEALRARSVVRRLLDFSRPSQDQRVPTDINELISQVLMLIRHLLRTASITLRLELWDEIPLIPIDPGQIQQVLHNLMQNAILAMPNGGTLTVRTSPVERAGKRWICIAVQDTGEGIPPENVERIFEPFFTARPGKNAGTGLGLSVSYGIIKSHQGLIEVESHPAEGPGQGSLSSGSLFTVYLPESAGS